MANTHENLATLFTAIAEKIRKKTGSTASVVADNFPAAMESILTPADGSIPTKTTSDLTASGATVTVPAGYYASTASKSIASATQATPSISVDGAGKITASATQSAGYVAAGTKNATKQLTIQAAKTVTPSTADQTAVVSGVYTTGAVTVKGDANLKADNIVEGVSIFGVTGTHSGGGSVETCTLNIVNNHDYGKLVIIGYTIIEDGVVTSQCITGKNSTMINNVLCNSILLLDFWNLEMGPGGKASITDNVSDFYSASSGASSMCMYTLPSSNETVTITIKPY